MFWLILQLWIDIYGNLCLAGLFLLLYMIELRVRYNSEKAVCLGNVWIIQ